MKRSILLIIFVAVTALWTAVPSASAQKTSLSENPTVTSNLQLLESWIEGQMKLRKLPGMSVGIVYDQDLIYARGFGYSDLKKKTPAMPQTLYRIASITKTFTATAIMQLRDAGKLELDDPVAKYLPWFNIKNRFSDAPEITIWHLLTHTSGLPREAAFPYWTDYRFPTREEMMEALPNQETVYPPEQKYKYSNLALALAGEVVEAVSGLAYDEYIEQHILRPLNMANTSVYPDKEERRRLATPYSILLSDGTRKVRPFTDSKGLTPAANMTSNVEDLARFISFQLRVDDDDTNRVLKKSTLREMQRVQWLNDDWNWGGGLGFRIRRVGDQTAVGHDGWVGGNRSIIGFVPERKFGIIVLTNSDDGNPRFFAMSIIKLMGPAFAKAAAPPAPVAQMDTAWLKYVGLYTEPSLFDTEILILDGKLVIYDSYPPEENPLDGVTELTPEGKHTFRMTGENGNGELVVFEMDKNGKVARVKIGENYIYPVGAPLPEEYRVPGADEEF